MATGHREPFIPVDLSKKEPVCKKPDGLPRQVGETSIHQIAMLSDDAGVLGWHFTVYVVVIAETIVRSLAYR
jgi:hypothetical protein